MTFFGWCLLGLTICIAIIAWNGVPNVIAIRRRRAMVARQWRQWYAASIKAGRPVGNPFDQDAA